MCVGGGGGSRRGEGVLHSFKVQKKTLHVTETLVIPVLKKKKKKKGGGGGGGGGGNPLMSISSEELSL